jgi:hypothetical protein
LRLRRRSDLRFSGRRPLALLTCRRSQARTWRD